MLSASDRRQDLSSVAGFGRIPNHDGCSSRICTYGAHPDDLDDGFVLLQEEDPSRSSVLCRFEIHGTGIQVTQLRWALCVVMRPDPALIEGLEPRAIGPAAFRAVFTKGDAMAGARFSDVPGLPYFAQELDLSVSSALWWGGFFWYTDGRSTAVYIRRADRGHSPARAGDPWF